jgi:division protein CdvB (Snf7/Vps24/ESCRT-III family)
VNEKIGFFFQLGIMSEMMNEAVDAVMDNNDLEEETDEEIAKVLDEILAGK